MFFVSFFLATACNSTVPEDQTVTKFGRVYMVDTDKPFSGVLTGYDCSHGKPGLRFEKKYVDGIQEGETFYYHPNGVVAAKEHYTKGLANGIASYYDENGNLDATIHLVDGLRGGKHGEAFFLMPVP